MFLRKVRVFHFFVDVMSAVPWHPHFSASLLVTVPWHSHFADFLLVAVPWHPHFGASLLVTVAWHPHFAAPLLVFGIPGNSVRNWMIEWVVKKVSILLHLIIPEFLGIPTDCFLLSNSGIPGNSYQFLLFIRFRNSVWNWMIEWVVKQVSILLHFIILELDDRMGSQTSINSITFYNSGIGWSNG
jgi:hypothetical protein